VASLAFLYALGTKAYILHLALGLVVMVGTLALRSRRREGRNWRPSSFWMRIRSRSWARPASLVVLLGAGLFLGVYWNARNWILKGSPFYPYEVSVEGAAAPNTGPGQYGLGLPRLEANLSALADKFGDRQGRILPDLPQTTGWGWSAYGMGLAATAWALWHFPPIRSVAAGFAVSALGLMASNTTSPWNMRYFIWLPALFAVALGAFLGHIRSPAVGRALAAMFIVCLGMNFVATVNYGLVPASELARMLALQVAERDAGRLRVRVPQEYENVYEFVPPEAVLGYNVHENGFIYPLYRADFRQRLVYVPVTAQDTCERIAASLEAAGTRYLFVAPEHTDDHLIARLRDCAGRDSPIRERAPGLYVVKRDGE
jgi:hypothetical protein